MRNDFINTHPVSSNSEGVQNDYDNVENQKNSKVVPVRGIDSQYRCDLPELNTSYEIY